MSFKYADLKYKAFIVSKNAGVFEYDPPKLCESRDLLSVSA